MNDLRASQVLQGLMFKNIWLISDKKSIVSGLWLREYEKTPLFNNCFLYVLSHKEFPYFKYYVKAWVMVTPGEKALYDQCTEESLIQYSLEIEEKTGGKTKANWDAIKSRESVLRIEYKKHFPSTRGMLLNYHYSFEEIMTITGKLNQEYFANLKG
jgi:hypothetical protein